MYNHSNYRSVLCTLKITFILIVTFTQTVVIKAWIVQSTPTYKTIDERLKIAMLIEAGLIYMCLMIFILQTQICNTHPLVQLLQNNNNHQLNNNNDNNA